MEYRQDNGSVCTCHPVNYPSGNTLQRLLIHGSEAYTPFYNGHRTSEPSSALGRQPELNNTFQSNVQKQNTTLQSVLLGEIPAEYSHLSTHQQQEPRNGCSPNLPQNSSCHTASLRIPNYHDNILSPSHVPSPHAMMSSPHLTRRATPSPHHRLSPGHMTSPIHMPCPTPPMHMASPAHCSSPYSTTSASPYSSSESCQDEPIDLSYKGSSSDTDDLYSSSPDCRGDSEFPMLRNLLCMGKVLQKRDNFSSSQESISSESETNYPFVTSTTRITLAKKNMFPVSSRVSDWLVKIVQFAKTIPEFQNLSHNDKVTLILNSWTRLLILYMSESNFQFVVTPLHNYNSQTESTTSNNPAPEEPTMKSVETVQNFIRKCQNMNLDQKEYAFLRMAVLFNAGKDIINFFFFINIFLQNNFNK